MKWHPCHWRVPAGVRLRQAGSVRDSARHGSMPAGRAPQALWRPPPTGCIQSLRRRRQNCQKDMAGLNAKVYVHGMNFWFVITLELR